MSMALMIVVVSWVYTYPQTPQLYTKNMYSFVHVNHTSIKWFIKKELLPNYMLYLESVKYFI